MILLPCNSVLPFGKWKATLLPKSCIRHSVHILCILGHFYTLVFISCLLINQHFLPFLEYMAVSLAVQKRSSRKSYWGAFWRGWEEVYFAAPWHTWRSQNLSACSQVLLWCKNRAHCIKCSQSQVCSWVFSDDWRIWRGKSHLANWKFF